MNDMLMSITNTIKLGAIIDYVQPTKYIVESTKYIEDGKTPVLTAGKGLYLGYTNEENGIFKATKENPVIIFDDFTTSFHWIDFSFKVKSSAMKILLPHDDSFNFRYIYYIMKTIKVNIESHTRQWISNYSNIEIPLPSIEIQNHIVKILDEYTFKKEELIINLKNEIKLLEEKLEYYHEKLLSGSDNLLKIKDLCTIISGGDIDKKLLSKNKTDEFPIAVVSNGIGSNSIYGYTNKAKIMEECVTVSARGTIGYAEYRNYPIYPIIRLLCLIPNQSIEAKYLMYVLSKIKYNIPKVGIPQLTKPMISEIVINVPDINRQKDTVKILDSLYKYTNELIYSLNGNIELIEKQYRYYMEKLLNFNN